MNETQALDAFAALSQATRLQMVRILVQAGPAGLPAGSVGEAVGVSSSGASFHLAHLERAGLIQSRREHRSIIYSARFQTLAGLVEFLMRDCCQGHPEVCAPAIGALSACCAEADAGVPAAPVEG
ncbi:transcriptional regulator [Kaistia sp. 32K]|uniref:ArsR/SmtB family transcription factor n=1 Tax=Kaistia sp. 32K TaxID=2795690 RepID=UPI0019157B09|nr:metalloregulator ArsR/SmtB family transcription factor [Kaistia sp. 32K]BCP54244.1 transcriptional regulator [Kaistia sp. 32K]